VKTYKIIARESVHYQYWAKAASKDEAKDKLNDGDYEDYQSQNDNVIDEIISVEEVDE